MSGRDRVAWRGRHREGVTILTHNRRFISDIGTELSRQRAKSAGRAATIRRLLLERDEHEAIIVGLLRSRELATPDLPDPTPKPWKCIWCGHVLAGGHEESKAHVCGCPANPLVQKIHELENQDGICQGCRPNGV